MKVESHWEMGGEGSEGLTLISSHRIPSKFNPGPDYSRYPHFGTPLDRTLNSHEPSWFCLLCQPRGMDHGVEWLGNWEGNLMSLTVDSFLGLAVLCGILLSLAGSLIRYTAFLS